MTQTGSLGSNADVFIGAQLAVAPDSRVTRELWNAPGIISKTRDGTVGRTTTSGRRILVAEQEFFLKFNEPQKSVGAWMHGIWLTRDLLAPQQGILVSGS